MNMKEAAVISFAVIKHALSNAKIQKAKQEWSHLVTKAEKLYLVK